MNEVGLTSRVATAWRRFPVALACAVVTFMWGVIGLVAWLMTSDGGYGFLTGLFLGAGGVELAVVITEPIRH